RYGSRKQFERLGGRTLVEIAVDLFAEWDGVVCALPVGAPEPLDAVAVVGGATRRQSVAAGVAAVPKSADLIAVHDAARPLASAELLAALVAALRDDVDATVPGRPVTDTVKRIDRAGSGE